MKFSPWSIDDTRCVLAPESAWQSIRDAEARCAADGMRETVLVGCDVFATAPVVSNESTEPRVIGLDEFGAFLRDALAADRFFALIDACPHLDWIITTSTPERVRECWPWNRDEMGDHKPNITLLAGPCYTQADVDRLSLLAEGLRDLCGAVGLAITPREELSLPFSSLAKHAVLRDGTEVRGLDLIVARGADQPLSPAIVRDIARQCDDAGARFVLESWGHYAPAVGDLATDTIQGESVLRPVGADRSGSALDGVERGWV